MINITGSITRAFVFPAIPETALIYYSDISRVAAFLPHISLVHTYAPNQIRMLYETVELGAYTIQIYSDLESSVDWDAKQLKVYPIKIETAAPFSPKPPCAIPKAAVCLPSKPNFLTWVHKPALSTPSGSRQNWNGR